VFISVGHSHSMHYLLWSFLQKKAWLGGFDV
jgi:hypothetical protein